MEARLEEAGLQHLIPVLEDSTHYLMLYLLFSLLPSKSGYNKGITNWKPNTEESRSGIVVHVKIPADIPTIIEAKTKQMQKYGLPVQPFVILQGPTHVDIEKVFVSFEDVLYEPVTFLKALNICFQLIHILNLNYPYESHHVWLFIQISMYDIKTVYDNIPNIINIASKINAQVD
ncbi:uncharacterized protein LOC143905675 [Temnothorax americanus]|uniref:uncharacterized protein LOC143905675 n=1 Tax=Temnothorax americanus TaxID=1964332 RepID=UPI004068C5ED